MSNLTYDGHQVFPVTASAVTTHGTVLEQAHAALVHARNSFEKHVNTTNESRQFDSAEGYRDQIAGFKNTDAAKAVDQAVANVKARRDQAQADADKVRRSLITQGDSAQESRNTRYWNRTKPLLDKAENAIVAAKNLIADASREELGVLLEELPGLPHNTQRRDRLDRHRNSATCTRVRQRQVQAREGHRRAAIHRTIREVPEARVRLRHCTRGPDA